LQLSTIVCCSLLNHLERSGNQVISTIVAMSVLEDIMSIVFVEYFEQMHDAEGLEVTDFVAISQHEQIHHIFIHVLNNCRVEKAKELLEWLLLNLGVLDFKLFSELLFDIA
jgi:hypothetical protein